MTVVDVSSDTIELQLTPLAEEDRNGIITGYVIEYFSSRGSDSIPTDSSTEFSLTVAPYTRYELRVAAVNAAGQGPFSHPVTTTTLEDGKLQNQRCMCLLSNSYFQLLPVHQHQ